jgi:hypothetical protein
MSTRYVRTFARQWTKAACTKLGYEYVETINESDHPTQSTWCSLEFDVFAKNKASFCGDTLERGDIILVVGSAPGMGDDAALIAIEAIAEEVYKQVDISNRLALVSLGSPDEATPNDGSPTYWLELSLGYELYSI